MATAGKKGNTRSSAKPGDGRTPAGKARGGSTLAVKARGPPTPAGKARSISSPAARRPPVATAAARASKARAPKVPVTVPSEGAALALAPSGVDPAFVGKL